jgi:hypothetical protein
MIERYLQMQQLVLFLYQKTMQSITLASSCHCMLLYSVVERQRRQQ